MKRDNPPGVSPRDVRMHGFTHRAEVPTVLDWIDAHTKSLGDEHIALDAAWDRVLSKPVTASIDVPAFDRVAMDGYALRGDETSGANEYNPLSFAISGEAFPARPFGGTVAAGTAVRVMTGSALPSNADAV